MEMPHVRILTVVSTAHVSQATLAVGLKVTVQVSQFVFLYCSHII